MLQSKQNIYVIKKNYKNWNIRDLKKGVNKVCLVVFYHHPFPTNANISRFFRSEKILPSQFSHESGAIQRGKLEAEVTGKVDGGDIYIQGYESIFNVLLEF